MRLQRIRALLVPLLAAGCYSYRAAEPAALPADAEVRARLTAGQADRLGDVLPAGTRVIEGTVLEDRGDALLLLVPVTSRLRGTRVDVLNQRLLIPRGELVDLELRELDRGRTALVVGAGVAVVGAIAIAALTGTDGGKGPDEPPETGERRRGPSIRLYFPLSGAH